MELLLHDIEHERLSPEEKRRRKAQKATYYGQLKRADYSWRAASKHEKI